MEELHIDAIQGTGTTIGKLFEEWKGTHPRAHIKQLHYSTFHTDCYTDVRAVGMINSVLIEYTEES